MPMENRNSDRSLPPIVLIPGVAGSKINAVNRKTRYSVRAWANTELIPFSSAKYAAQYLWGQVGDDGVFHSFCEDFVDIEVIDGLPGCDQILDLEVFGVDVFNKLKLGIYFSEMVKFFETLGYVYGENLRCFTYDWRQVPYLPSIQKRLGQLIDELHSAHGKVHLIGHSLGGLVVDYFIRKNVDFHHKIAQFIALATPFDGCGALALEGALLGYPLKLPIPRCSAKQMQCNGAGTLTLGQHPDSKSCLVSKVFVKFICDAGQKRDERERSAPNDRAFVCEAYDLEAQKTQFPDSSSQRELTVKLHPEVYSDGECPDVLFLIAQRILLHNPTLPKYCYGDIRKLQKACRPGAISLAARIPVPHIVQQSPCCIEKKEKRERFLSAMTSRKETFETVGFETWDGRIFQTVLNEDTEHIMRLKESTGILSQYECAEIAAVEQLQRQGTVPAAHKRGSYYQLVEECHTTSILDQELYRPNFKVMRECEQEMLRPATQSEIRFRSVCGTGVDTAFHIIFDKPVRHAAELLEQEPSFAMVPGDGTVSLLGSLGDPYSGERVVLDGMTHFGCVMDQRVYDLIRKWVVDDFAGPTGGEIFQPIE